MEKTKCRAEKCKRAVRAKGYCDNHYRAWRRGELPKARFKQCKSENCKKPMISKGYCKEHFESWKTSRKHVARVVEGAKKAQAAAATPAPAPQESAPAA